LSRVVVNVVEALAPVEFQATLPNFSLASASGISVLLNATELTTIAKLFTLRGGFAKLGLDFEGFIAKIIPKPAAKQVIINGLEIIKNRAPGSAVIDFLYDEFILEAKLSAKSILRNENQIRLFARFAKETGRTLRYIFLVKPSIQEIEGLLRVAREGAADVKVDINYLFSSLAFTGGR